MSHGVIEAHDARSNSQPCTYSYIFLAEALVVHQSSSSSSSSPPMTRPCRTFLLVLCSIAPLFPTTVIGLSTTTSSSTPFSTSIMSPKPLFRVRTITAFLQLEPEDFESDDQNSNLDRKIQKSSAFLSSMQEKIEAAGYEVQTVRIATNPFGQYLGLESDPTDRLAQIDAALTKHNIQICALGPAENLSELQYCPQIVASSSKLSCSANIQENDVTMARAVADCIVTISKLDNGDASLQGGLGNFRFCGASCCETRGIPFFPGANAGSNSHAFAIGLENGPLAHQLLSDCASLANIPTIFSKGMAAALRPLQTAMTATDDDDDGDDEWKFVGIDTSLNPSLDSDQGSVAAALEMLDEVETFGGPGTVAAAAAVTQALQSLPGIQTTGYCGFMLPVCEDLRLAALPSLRITNLLSVSAVCGVGVDTVPLAGNVPAPKLTALLLDVANLAARWNKPLSCRVFPVPGSKVGDRTDFDSPYLCNSQIFDIE